MINECMREHKLTFILPTSCMYGMSTSTISTKTAIPQLKKMWRTYPLLPMKQVYENKAFVLNLNLARNYRIRTRRSRA